MSDPFDMSPEPRTDTSYLKGHSATTSTHTNTEHTEHTEHRIQAMERVSKMRKGPIFKSLTSQQSTNDFGLLDFIYRADLIPGDIMELPTTERREILDAAIVPISFEYGYPATPDAHPLWERLPGETQEAYDIFVFALELPEISKSTNPVRILPIIAHTKQVEISELAEYNHIYYWPLRFRAYDLYLAAAHRKQREQRVMTVEGKHFTWADNYLTKLDRIIEAKLDATINAIHDEESPDFQDLKLKDLVDMVDKLSRIQRVSVGLPANGNDTSPSRDIGGRLQNIDDSYREIAEHASPAKKIDNRSADMDSLLSDPESLANMQDLLIKFHEQGRGPK